MTVFLTKSACKGRRPENILGERFVSRPELIALLLRNRGVARFVVAPNGFGKSCLAFEYANTVFSFRNVFWINAKSPCFLRDLDSGDMADQLLLLEKGKFLAVFDNVSQLDSTRAEAFSQVIDTLMDKGNEVLVTCTPAHDVFGELQHDRARLGAQQLLLTDAELRECGVVCAEDAASEHALALSHQGARILRPEGARRSSRDGEGAREMPPLASLERIPGFAWGTDRGMELLRDVAKEELPAEMKLALFVALVLGSGELRDVRAFASSGADCAMMEFLRTSYPFLGIDDVLERFSAAKIPMPIVCAAFSPCFDAFASLALCRNREELLGSLASVLLKRGRAVDACELLAAAAAKSTCAAWLDTHVWELTGAACFLPASELYRKSITKDDEACARLQAAQAWRLALLGDEAAAVPLARKVAYALKEEDGARAFALLALVRFASQEVASRAMEDLSSLLASVCRRRAFTFEDVLASARVKGAGAVSWKELSYEALALARGDDEAARCWLRLRNEGRPRIELCVLGVEIIEMLSKRESEGSLFSGRFTETEMEFVRSLVEENRLFGDASDFFAAALIWALDADEAEGVVRFCLGDAFRLPRDAHECARRIELSLYEQRKEHRALCERRAAKRAEYLATHTNPFRKDTPASARASASVRTPVPLLEVDLFGGLEVRIGGKRVAPSDFRRQKTKTLLALLVLNRGREYSRDALVRELWPGSTLDSARKNLYAVWSHLRSVLETPEGYCPYLIRDLDGCRLDAKYVVSDVSRFEELCRTLMFDTPDVRLWEQLLSDLRDRFSCDLLPSECDCERIVHERNEYRARLTDALSVAAKRLLDEQEATSALWLAREALQRDRSREDSYVTLMKSQIAAGQRSAALDTYFSCSRYLQEELGIDPPSEAVKLYHAIIESDSLLD